jgi:hypothetical protein
MTWPFSGSKSQERRARDRQLAEAEWEVARIRERAERVAAPLRKRLDRNHWSEAVAAIARRDT